MARSDPKSVSPSHRLERVAESVRHAIADLLSRGEIVDPVLNKQVVTIPFVRMSPDLKLATVAIMPLGGKNADKTIAALTLHKKQLRALVAHRVNLKYAPDLRFVLDTSFDAQSKIDALLRSPAVARDLGPEPTEE
jgi:ribosome-binding factor A